MNALLFDCNEKQNGKKYIIFTNVTIEGSISDNCELKSTAAGREDTQHEPQQRIEGTLVLHNCVELSISWGICRKKPAESCYTLP